MSVGANNPLFYAIHARYGIAYNFSFALRSATIIIYVISRGGLSLLLPLQGINGLQFQTVCRPFEIRPLCYSLARGAKLLVRVICALFP